MTRRDFLRTSTAAVLGTAMAPALAATERSKPVLAKKLPRWRGFNLLEKFRAEKHGPFRDSDFDLLAQWKFDFVRLPMSYLCWTDPKDPGTVKEKALADIDQAIKFGQARKIHVNLNFHRAPGYCVNPPKEPLDLWTDPKALDLCAHHWATLAKRYRGIPSAEISFDLLNEPPVIPEEQYAKVARRLVEAIRAEDPERLVIADGLDYGKKTVPSLIDLGIGQSTRGYAPVQISHWKANWMHGSDTWPEPTWPLKQNNQSWDKERLHKQCIIPWQELEKKGVGIHVGEWGAYNKTPHKVVLAWMRDNLDLWKTAGWGWALWNLRGSFGVLDSGRSDVKYEEFKGMKLDREMLELLVQG